MKCICDKAPSRPLSELKLAITAAALLACGAAWSQSPADNSPSFSIKGFGTVGLTHATVKQADVLPNGLVEHGAGYTDDWSYKVDTRFGVQLDARLNNEISGLLQVTSEQRYDGSFRPEVEWASIKYQPTSAFSVQAGRLVLSSFLVSDHRLVGYANHWVRPPMEVYNLIPITNIDGVSARYRARFGDTSNTTQLSFGDFKRKGPDGIVLRTSNGWNITNTTEFGSLTFNASYQQGRLNVEYPEMARLFAGYRNAAFVPFIGNAGQALADKYDPSNRKVTFAGVGASYDPGNWFVMGEWGHLNMRSILGERKGWYVSSGYRTGSLTPYAIYSQSRTLTATRDSSVPSLSPQLAELNAGLNTFLATLSSAQKSAAVGVRWDFTKKAAFKAQFDHVRPAAGSYGELRNIQTGYPTGQSYNMFSVTLDFLF